MKNNTKYFQHIICLWLKHLKYLILKNFFLLHHLEWGIQLLIINEAMFAQQI